MEKRIKNLEMWKALKTVLRINYNLRHLDTYISSLKVEWYLAVQFKRDPSKTWHPRIVVYLPHHGRVGIFVHSYDLEPTWVAASTVMAMAENKVIDPNPNFPITTA